MYKTYVIIDHAVSTINGFPCIPMIVYLNSNIYSDVSIYMTTQMIAFFLLKGILEHYFNKT